MSNSSHLNRKTKIIASVAIFSALYTVLRLIQTIPMIGVSGARFSLSDAVAPVFGVVLGPYVGGLSVILGTFIAIVLGRPVQFMFLDFLPALVNAVALGFLSRRKWWPAVVLYAALLIGFLINPLTSVFINVGGVEIPFVWLHLVAFIVLLSPPGRKAGAWIQSLEPKKLTAGIAISAFIGTMTQHLMGNILYETILNQFYVLLGQQPIVPAIAYPANWTLVFFLYPWERLILIVIAVIIGVPLVRVLYKSFLRPEQDSKPKTN
jgi:uncharacterized membrane protein